MSERGKPNVLDPRQLVRIEALHRGFLYQHLYVANCLLRAVAAQVEKIVVEGDEDVEVHRGGGCLYIQVKTRQGFLEVNDIAGALDRFASIRAEHVAGERPGAACFVIASNAIPAQKLAALAALADWPADVEIHWPTGTALNPALPLPPNDVVAAASACCILAAQLPFSTLRPETLTWKLASSAMLAASGTLPRSDHAFRRDELPALFEQLAVQMQDFPAPPPIYRAQIGEPPLSTGMRVRVLSGLSGAGKTAWVAEAATHLATPAVYLDVAEMPGAALASAVSREVVAKLFGRSQGVLGEIILPGASGIETLGALNVKLRKEGQGIDIVIDNAHRLSPSDLKTIVDQANCIRFLLLCQPGKAARDIAVSLGVEQETLAGWDEDTIAAVIDETGCVADYADCERLSRLTGGLPFYVVNAAAVAKREYDGRLAAFCSDVEAQTNLIATAQEVILKRVFDAMPADMREIVAMLSLADVPLSRDEASTYIRQVCKLTEPRAIGLLRQLPESGAVEFFSNAGIKVHDAMRPLGRAHFASGGADRERDCLESLASTIIETIQKHWTIARVALLVRLFGQLGRVKVLVEFATDELFHEIGVWREIEPFLVATAEDMSGDAETRFWAIDGLVFNDLREGNVTRALERIKVMRDLLDNHELGPDEWLAWAMKRMVALSVNEDVDGFYSMLAEVEARLPANEQHCRIFRYNRAVAMFKLKSYDLALRETESLIQEYYDLLGLSPEQVLCRNPPDILPLLPKDRDNRDDLKHLADTLDLHAQTLQQSGGRSPFGRLHAMKFYAMAQAPESIIRVGQDLVDEFCERNDFLGAREVIENTLLPTIQSLNLISWVLPVRSQYAVVLACLGEFDVADSEMRRLAAYEPGLSSDRQGELRNQRRFIAHLRQVGPPKQRKVVIPPALQELLASRAGQAKQLSQRRTAVGRNEPCPCRSGRKYKHCHGR